MLITIALISLLFSAFFSGVEIAFIAANKLQLELDKSKGRFSSKMISFFGKNESDFITTMLVGNNIALVVYGVVMTQILTPKLESLLSSDLLLSLTQLLNISQFEISIIFKSSKYLLILIKLVINIKINYI